MCDRKGGFDTSLQRQQVPPLLALRAGAEGFEVLQHLGVTVLQRFHFIGAQSCHAEEPMIDQILVRMGGGSEDRALRPLDVDTSMDLRTL